MTASATLTVPIPLHRVLQSREQYGRSTTIENLGVMPPPVIPLREFSRFVLPSEEILEHLASNTRLIYGTGPIDFENPSNETHFADPLALMYVLSRSLGHDPEKQALSYRCKFEPPARNESSCPWHLTLLGQNYLNIKYELYGIPAPLTLENRVLGTLALSSVPLTARGIAKYAMSPHLLNLETASKLKLVLSGLIEKGFVVVTETDDDLNFRLPTDLKQRIQSENLVERSERALGYVQLIPPGFSFAGRNARINQLVIDCLVLDHQAGVSSTAEELTQHVQFGLRGLSLPVPPHLRMSVGNVLQALVDADYIRIARNRSGENLYTLKK